MKFFSALIFFLTISSLSCERAKPEQEQTFTPPPVVEAAPQVLVPGTENKEVPTISLGNVLLSPKVGAPILLTVEVAQSAEERKTGLMGRENLPDNHGMWFVFSDDVQDPFWMKNTPLALDLIFVDKDSKIVDIIANATPNSELLLVSHQKYRYVLEVKAGSAANYKIETGDKAEFRLGPP
ncbi:MAG: DUF192 domain-containing protein [Deltaproteobacteria bacterium]|nr:DUF192 domain-containing protein [Deltaproteobacteria bacterium]